MLVSSVVSSREENWNIESNQLGGLGEVTALIISTTHLHLGLLCLGLDKLLQSWVHTSRFLESVKILFDFLLIL